MEWKNINLKYKSNLEVARSQDAFALLNVSRDITADNLRKIYLAKVKAYHPDCSDAFLREYNQEMLKLINVAYEKIRRELFNE